MEDKRTLYAFLLIGLILLLIPYYYEWVGLGPQPIPEQREEVTPTPTEEVTSAPALAAEPRAQDPPETAGRQPLPPLVPTATPEAFVAREVVVNTPLQRLVFSTRGGVLISAQLLNYYKLDGDIVDLIPPGGAGLALALNRGGGEEDLTGIEFAPDSQGLRLEFGEQATLRMTAELGSGRRVEKRFTFSADRHGFEMDLRYAGFADEPHLLVGWRQGIANTEEDPGTDMPGGFVGAQAIGSVAYMGPSGEEDRITVDDDDPMVSERGNLSWAGVANQYFFLALAPVEPGHYNLELYPHQVERPFLWERFSFRVGARIQDSGNLRTMVYAGPLDYEELKSYDLALEQGIDLGWPIIRDISKVLLVVFLQAHDYVPNYGWVLILFAIAIKIVTYPLTKKSYESMGKMQALQPKIAALREKHKNDNQKLSQATMTLYKEEGVSPLGSCLPMLLQMPIFFALYRLFYNIELRQAPFISWIDDLSRPDEIMIDGFGLHILPLLMAGSMFVQQKMTMKDPKQAMLVYMMPAFLLVIFWSLPSGLVLYWTVFNILQIVQQLWINKQKFPISGSPG